MEKRKKPGTDLKKVVALEEYRKNRSEERKREYERVLFNRVLGVYSFAEKTNMHHVEVLDISFSGIRFREENPESPLHEGQKVPLRFYFTPSSYLRLIVEIKRVAPYEEDGKAGLEYGCTLDQKTKSYEAIEQLISFMYKYSEVACQDQNPPLIWF